MVVQEESARLEASVSQTGGLCGEVANSSDGAEIQRVIAECGLQDVSRNRRDHETAIQTKSVHDFPFEEGVLKQESGAERFRRLAQIGIVGFHEECQILPDFPTNHEPKPAHE